MQMKKTKNKGKIKTTIMIIVIAIILLLLAFSEDIMKLANKNQINLAQNVQNSTGSGEPNIPTISAGMIPVKWDGTNWVITTKKDTNWYDYENGSPAYIMLNDGVYQSELIRDMTNKKLAEENIGEQIQENELGTIFMWIPRFTYNSKDEIQYTQAEVELGEDWTTPEIFMYLTNDETKPDYSLNGIWIEEKADNSYSSKIKEMNKEEGIYGFLAHTKAVQINKTDTDILQKYVENDATVIPLNDITSTNKIILKILNENKYEPIKAKIAHNESEGKIEITITYTKNGIAKIVYKAGTELSFEKTDKTIVATIDVKPGNNHFTVIDNKNNKKELEVTVIPKLYATLYKDGSNYTLVFTATDRKIEGKTVYKNCGDMSNRKDAVNKTPWYYDRGRITQVDILDKIYPTSTIGWFYGFNIKSLDLSNLDTSNVTNMDSMFGSCSGLSTLDLSHLNTSNVTNMDGMFGGCSGLSTLDVSYLDTSNVTSMDGMFRGCKSLTSLDLRSFDTKNVTDMSSMFSGCRDLTDLNLSNLNTSHVTRMSHMFNECSSLTSLDLKSFDTRNVTSMEAMFLRCTSLTSLDLRNFDTKNVTYMGNMFQYCSALSSVDLTSFDTSSATSMLSMFYGCSALTTLDLTSFDTGNVKTMTSMFHDCTKLQNIYVSRATWKLSSVTVNMFTGCGTSSVTYVD